MKHQIAASPELAKMLREWKTARGKLDPMRVKASCDMLSELAKAEMLDYDSLLRDLHKWRSRAEQAEATCDRLEKAGAAYLQRALEAEAALDRLKPFSITVKRLPGERG
jgi:predicted phage gp36 major capsid-like protein